MTKTETTLATLATPLRLALQRMLSKEPERRPFVRVEQGETGPFVQFCGSREEALIFDCPALGAQSACTLGAGLELAELGLRQQGVSDDETLTIVEDDQHSRWKGITRSIRNFLRPDPHFA